MTLLRVLLDVLLVVWLVVLTYRVFHLPLPPAPEIPEALRERIRERVADLRTSPGRERLRARLEAIRARRG